MFEGLFRGEHLLIILVIVLLVFGPSKLPQVGSALGRTIRDFKKGITGAMEEHDKAPGSEAPAAKKDG